MWQAYRVSLIMKNGENEPTEEICGRCNQYCNIDIVSRETSHILPVSVEYGVSVASILEKLVIVTGTYCICKDMKKWLNYHRYFSTKYYLERLSRVYSVWASLCPAAGLPIAPGNRATWDAQLLKIPAVSPSIMNCCVIKVEYYVKVRHNSNINCHFHLACWIFLRKYEKRFVV